MMRDLGLLGHGRLGCTDIHVAIELAGINVDDLSVERLRNGQGKSRFPHRSGTNNHQKRLLHGGTAFMHSVRGYPPSSALHPALLDTWHRQRGTRGVHMQATDRQPSHGVLFQP